MGHLIYDTTTRIDIDDRALAHLQVVILNKLRRKESLAFSWRESAVDGSGRGTIWISPEISLCFMFSGGRAPVLSRPWIDMMMATANTPSGLHITPEPETADNASSLSVHMESSVRAAGRR